MSTSSDARSLLVELGTEELPPLAVRPALVQLREEGEARFRDARLRAEAIQTLGTSRRLVLYVARLASRQDDLVREVRGPAARVAYDAEGRPTRAAEGFARGQGVAVEHLVRRTVAEGEYVFARLHEAGRPAAEVLGDLIPGLFADLRFPKAMRWGAGEVRFARPVRWLLALYGRDVIPASFAGVQAGRRTYGHRFLAPGPHTIDDPSGYLSRISEFSIHLDPAAREREIRAQAEAAADAAGGRPIIVPDLLEETVFTAEHPAALSGCFAEEFLDLPREVLVTVMQHHQKYFPVEDAGGRLLPAFVAVRDGASGHDDVVRQGHEWVLRARLTDARFFFADDRRQPLAGRVEALRTLVFQERLGTMAEKVTRLQRLAGRLGSAAGLGPEDLPRLVRAATLCKADLVTRMVTEFPELQGVMGREYARLDGEPEPVALAIEEHYRPRGAEDDPPRTRIGALLALADRVDTLVGHLAVGLGARGSEDPYGLRRAAGGIVTISIAHEFTFPLSWLVREGLAGYAEMAAAAKIPAAGTAGEAEALAAVRETVFTRLRGRLEEEGIPYDVIEASLAAGDDDLLSAAKRVRALAKARQWEEFPRLFIAYDRASRILPRDGAEGRREGAPPGADHTLLVEPAERALLQAMGEVDPVVRDAVRRGDYLEALRALLRLAGPVDRLFDDVLIMAPDPAVRAARLGLCGAVAALFRQVADLSRIVMPGETKTVRPEVLEGRRRPPTHPEKSEGFFGDPGSGSGRTEPESNR